MTSGYTCPCDVEADEGICHVPSEEDGLPVRCVGEWSANKHYYIERYIDTFHTSMGKKYGSINYIDLFAGPGKCRTKRTREMTAGSPLIASRFGFTHFHLVEMNPVAVDALRVRFPNPERATFYPVDCNLCAPEVRRRLSDYSINLLVADQTTVQLRFETLRLLAEVRRLDLIIYFPTGMYFKRALPKMKDKEKIRDVNAFFGDDGEGIGIWRSSPASARNSAIVAYYKERLKTIGYQFDRDIDRDIPIMNEEKNYELYRLIFASKHPLGTLFWRRIQRINHRGQRDLPF
jgi:three-Cys-motif partner protein